jgi:hypothetical protein
VHNVHGLHEVERCTSEVSSETAHDPAFRARLLCERSCVTLCGRGAGYRGVSTVSVGRRCSCSKIPKHTSESRKKSGHLPYQDDTAVAIAASRHMSGVYGMELFSSSTPFSAVKSRTAAVALSSSCIYKLVRVVQLVVSDSLA